MTPPFEGRLLNVRRRSATDRRLHISKPRQAAANSRFWSLGPRLGKTCVQFEKTVQEEIGELLRKLVDS
jgi:hypothetical protein